jgi:hypothetical protein
MLQNKTQDAIPEMFQNVGRKMSGESRGLYLFVHEHDESRNLTTSTVLNMSGINRASFFE